VLCFLGGGYIKGEESRTLLYAKGRCFLGPSHADVVLEGLHCTCSVMQKGWNM